MTKTKEGMVIPIGKIFNYYGGLQIRTQDGKFYWGIENYDGTEWKEIPESLFKTLKSYENKRIKTLKDEKNRL